MRLTRFVLACSLVLGACGGAAPRASTPETAATTATTPVHHEGLQIKHTAIYVDDQDKALHVYTDVLGFAKKDDVKNGPYRWLTVVSPGDKDGAELQLALDDDPAAKALQQALDQQHQPATMFYVDDVKAEVERLTAKGAQVAMPRPT